ncbi:MAG: M48 family metallopeptidase [Planctomycetes bacterium]|nr:M48 family metallopeptidase [Planctomycetota bacterium]
MWTPDSLAETLTQQLGAPVQVTFTRSRSTPVQAKAPTPGPFAQAGADLRLHTFFTEAPTEVVTDLAHWLRVGKRARAASQRLDAYIHASVAQLPAKTPRRIHLNPSGSHYELLPLLEVVRAQEFPDNFTAPPRDSPALPLPAITWSQQNPRGKLRSLRLGSYNRERNLVRIHPLLDDKLVPEFFVRYIIFHELLHAVHKSLKDTAGRWVHHSQAFRQREAQYPDYQAALKWEAKGLWTVAKKQRKQR